MNAARWLPALLLLFGGIAFADTATQIAATTDWLNQVGNSQFSKALTAFQGNPFSSFFGVSSSVASSALYIIWVGIGQAIATVGLALRLQAIGFTEGDGMKAFWKAVMTYGMTVALMSWIYVPGAYSLKTIITKSVTGSYVYSVKTFGKNVDSKLDQSKEAFYEMLASTATVATAVALPEAGGAMFASTKALAATAAAGGSRAAVAKAATAAASGGFKKAGVGAVGFIMEKLGGTMTVLSTFLTGYGSLLEAAGWGIVVLLVGLPLGLALINFQQYTMIWTMFGTWMGTLLALLIMPLVLVHAIDTAFIQPVKAMNYYNSNLGIQAQRMEALAQTSNAQVKDKLQSQLDDCTAARQTDPANIDSGSCNVVINEGFLSNFKDLMTDGIRSIANQIEMAIASVADGFVSFGVMLFRLGAGLFFAALIMFGVPALAIAMFGGIGLRK